MIEIKVSLISANTGERTELARMHIANDGTGSESWGNYRGETFRGRDKAALDKGAVQRRGRVEQFPRRTVHVWNPIFRMLQSMGYR